MHENDISFLAPEYKQILGRLYSLYVRSVWMGCVTLNQLHATIITTLLPTSL